LLDQAVALEQRGARRREDALRVATWRLDAIGSADRALLVNAARLARYSHDFAQVRRLARAAFEVDPDTEAGLLLGEALFELGAFTDSETVLAAAQHAAATERELLQVVAERTKNLVWGLLRAPDALAVNRTVLAGATSADVRNELIADQASILMFSGHPRPCLDLLDQLENVADLRTRVLRAIAEAPALVVTGQ